MPRFIYFYLIISLIFMSVVTWDMLAKNQTDPETVEEAVARLVAAHTAEETAHLGVGESLEEHKTDPVADHPAESVVNDKIQIVARAFTYIVDAAGDGDYTTIQAAIDAAHALGGGRIFIKNGTYVQAADITMYSNIELVGEDNDNTIIDFFGGNNSIICTGAVNLIFDNLNIINSYDVNGALYLNGADNVTVRFCKFIGNYDIANSRGYAIKCGGDCIETLIEYCFFTSNYNDIAISEGYNFRVLNCTFDGTQNNSILVSDTVYYIYIENNLFDMCGISAYTISITNGRYVVINNNSQSSDDANGWYFNGNYSLRIISNRASSGGADAVGAYVTNSDKVVIVGNDFSNNTLYGIELISDSDNCILSNNVCMSCTYGVYITGATCNSNIVLGNQLASNSSGSIYDTGTGTLKEHNIT
jgi:parallel beta-helix repeat protein